MPRQPLRIPSSPPLRTHVSLSRLQSLASPSRRCCCLIACLPACPPAQASPCVIVSFALLLLRRGFCYKSGPSQSHPYHLFHRTPPTTPIQIYITALIDRFAKYDFQLGHIRQQATRNKICRPKLLGDLQEITRGRILSHRLLFWKGAFRRAKKPSQRSLFLRHAYHALTRPHPHSRLYSTPLAPELGILRERNKKRGKPRKSCSSHTCCLLGVASADS